MLRVTSSASSCLGALHTSLPRESSRCGTLVCLRVVLVYHHPLLQIPPLHVYLRLQVLVYTYLVPRTVSPDSMLAAACIFGRSRRLPPTRPSTRISSVFQFHRNRTPPPPHPRPPQKFEVSSPGQNSGRTYAETKARDPPPPLFWLPLSFLGPRPCTSLTLPGILKPERNEVDAVPVYVASVQLQVFWRYS